MTPRRPLTIVHTDFHRGWGGQIGQILTCCRGLQDRGHSVILAVPGDGEPAARARKLGVEVCGDVRFKTSAHPVSLLRDAGVLRRLMRERRVDILHTHGSQDTWAGALANKLLPGGPRIPHLLTRHNTKVVRDNAANRWLIGRGLDRVIVVARSVIERYQPFIDRGLLDPTRIPVVPSPLRPDLLAGTEPDRGALRSEIGAAPGDLVVGTLARLVPDKGQASLIDAAAALAAAGLAPRVVLAGVGTDEGALRERAAARGLGQRTHFLGYRTDVRAILAGLDIAVLPSVDCDASSGMIKEALACGTPTVATDIGAARELLGDGAFGRVVAPGDAAALATAIRELSDDRDAARARAAEGGAVVRRDYTVDRFITQLEDVYYEHARA